MVKRSDLESLIIEEWRKRPTHQRTGSDVLGFYAYLERERPDLLAFRALADKYQVLKVILRPYIEARTGR